MYLIVTANKELVERAKLNGDAVFVQTQVANTEVCFEAKKEIRRGLTVGDVMAMLAISPNLKGYDYIKYIMEMCAKNPKYHHESMTKEIYPSCAKVFDTTASRVERAIRHAVERSFTEVPEMYFKLFNRKLEKPPMNSEFISMLSKILEQSNE